MLACCSQFDTSIVGLQKAIFHDTARPGPYGLLHKPSFSHSIPSLHLPKIACYSRRLASAAVNACPVGWHLPSDEEWKTLERNLGMNNSDANATGWRYSGLVGGSLKETGNMHWMMPAMGATNKSGFSALPGGDRDSDVGFINLGAYCYFWSSTADSTSRAWYRRLNNDNAGVHRSSSRQGVGYSVRCLKN